ncbi:E3 ubiquitin-protein ligase MARCHF6-like [Watersipora subatra]|uniref:E3 ubiquitin-protein ligase MARCHF6-like n=1 Tax=Watersipora subatra TaxID=2589382 RepID=UPI00355B2212
MAEEHLDICRVCRSEGTADKPLFYPCVCTGSIKYIHQDCLVQWLKYSNKEFCELCKHKFSFTPIYAADMPQRLPLFDIMSGLLKSIVKGLKYWFHYTLVAIAWLGVVPLTACRICRCLFTGSVSTLLTLPLDMLSTENIGTDALQGTFVVFCSLCIFISLVWLREQLVHGGIPDWLQNNPSTNQLEACAYDFFTLTNEGRPAGDQPEAAVPNGEPAEFEDGWVDIDEEEVEEDDGQDENGPGDVAPQPQAPVDNQANWNPMGWDRAPEELTWERLLGLDGSLVFLEHVFWVISLNTLFVLIFAFCPYHIGQWTINGLRMTAVAESSKFEGVLTTMVGYVMVAICLVLLHTILGLVRLQKIRMAAGLCYIVVKVSILIVAEIGLFPLICGWWLDICSLPMFNATLSLRMESFKEAPGTIMFAHWLIGMVYVFYFASFILLLREVLRPGVLFFLRNVNDPEFNPIHEMVHINVYRHTRRFVLSLLIFGFTVMLMLWLPIRFIRVVFTGFLPYHMALSNDAPVSELTLELLLLQVVLPSLLDQGHTRTWLKNLVVYWSNAVAWLLDLKSYLLGTEDLSGKPAERIVRDPNEPVRWGNANLGAAAEPVVAVGEAHQALLNVQGPSGFQAYCRPEYFHLRVITLVILTCFSLFLASVISLILPVLIGRKLMNVWMPETKVHELYTAACGLYVCWLILRGAVIFSQWIPLGWNNLCFKLKEWITMGNKVLILTVLLVGVVPLLIGLLFDQILVVPLRVPLDQSPVFFPWQNWALGVLHTKIICGLTMMGPQWWLRRNVEQLYNNGLWNLNLKDVLQNLCLPVILLLGLTLAIPYAFSKSIVPYLGLTFEGEIQLYRRIYPSVFTLFCMTTLIIFNFKQFKKLYEHIKNDKYLVGRRLVNYDKHITPAAASTPMASA